MEDAFRFISRCYDISMAPLQIYNSALVFSPEASVVRGLFSHEMPVWVERVDVFVARMEIAPNGQLLASIFFDETVRLWDPSTGAFLGTLEGHSGSVRAVVFSPNSRLLASASDMTVRLWDPSTRASRGTLEGHSGSVRAVVFSPNSRLLASASSDKTVRLWDIETKRAFQKFDHIYRRHMSFSKDGSRLVLDGREFDVHSSSSTDHSHEEDFTNISYSLDLKSEWVLYKGSKVLWLPSHIRLCDDWVIRGNNLVIRLRSAGQITLLQFSNTVAPF